MGVLQSSVLAMIYVCYHGNRAIQPARCADLLSWSVHEQAAAIVETKLKMSDIAAAVEVCCLVHERYTDFADLLLTYWQRVLLQKKDDKVT